MPLFDTITKERLLDAVECVLHDAAPQLPKGEGLDVGSLIEFLGMGTASDRLPGGSMYLQLVAELRELHGDGSIVLAPSVDEETGLPTWDVFPAEAKGGDVEGAAVPADKRKTERGDKALRKLKRRLKRAEEFADDLDLRLRFLEKSSADARHYETPPPLDRNGFDAYEERSGVGVLSDGSVVDRGIREGIFR